MCDALRQLVAGADTPPVGWPSGSLRSWSREHPALETAQGQLAS